MLLNITSALKVVALAIVLSFGISYVYAWTAPAVAAPGGNVAAPINTSATAQTKTGELTVGGLTLPVGKIITAGGSNTTYGAVTVQGSKNTWSGINFKDSAGSSAGTLMMHPSYSGFYNAADANWRMYVTDTAGATGGNVYANNYYIGESGTWASSAGASFPNYSGGISRGVNTTYQASSNGYLSVVAWGSYMNNLDIWVGPTSASTLIWRMGDDLNSYTKGGSAMIPIKAGAYYYVASPGGSQWAQYTYENVRVNFFPAN